MKEFHLTFDEHFRKGLRPNERVSLNRSFLEKAQAVQSTEYGLEYARDINVNAFDSIGVFGAPPNDNIFIEDDKILFYNNVFGWLYDITDIESGTYQSYTKYDGRDPSSTVNIVDGGPLFHIAISHDSWYMFNGTSVIFKTNHRKLGQLSNKVLTIEDVSINTGVQHRGRIILGGFDPTDFWGDGWDFIFNSWKDSLEEPLPFEQDDVGSNWVMWSSIGGGDFPLWLFYPELAVEGNIVAFDDSYDYKVDNMMLMDRLQRGEFGFMPMPWKGTVNKIIPMGNRLIVYGDNGIAALTPTRDTSPYPSTFGLKHIRGFGTIQRGCAAGDENSSHMFIDKAGDLFLLNGDLQVTRLGYSEFLKPLLDGDDYASMSYEDRYNNYYINANGKVHVFDNGFTEIPYSFNRVYYYNGELIALGQDNIYDDIEIKTCPFDFGRRGRKTITGLLLGVSYTDGNNPSLEISFDYKESKNGSFVESPKFPINSEGYSEIRVSGVEFKLNIYGTDLNNFQLDYAEIRYQHEDKRFVRGTSTSQAPS